MTRLGTESGVTLLAYLALENLQHALLAAGASQLALPYLESVESLALGETAAFASHFGLTLIAEGYALAGDVEGASRFMERADSIALATGMHPTGYEEHVRAVLALQEGAVEEGIAHLERARANSFGLLLGDAEAARGRMDVAVAHYDTVTTSYGLNWTESGLYAPLRPLAHERAANAFLALGDTASALRHLAAFVDLWRNADPELQPRVESANRLLEQLAGER